MLSHTLIIGGGPAGIACALGLRSHGWRGRITLVDASGHHVVQPALHEWQGEDDPTIRVPFRTIAEKLELDFVRGRVDLRDVDLRSIDRAGVLRVGGHDISFDHLVLATGSSEAISGPPGAIGLGELRERWLADPEEPRTIVGGGATAVQIAASLAEQGATLTVVTAEQSLLEDLPRSFGEYARRFLEAHGATIITGKFVDSVAPGTLWLTGVRADPSFGTDPFGLVRIGGAALERVFAVGDASTYEGSGLNGFSAQAAVAKGKLVAENIRRRASGRWLRAYRHRSKGYVLALGRSDAIAWVLQPTSVVCGVAALTIHEAIALQYRAMLRGVDLFVQAN